MPAVAAVTLNDGASTPVAQLFSPVSASIGQTTLVNRVGNTAAGNRTLILGYDPAKGNRPTHRVNVRFNYPVEVLNTTTGVYEVAYTGRISCDIVIPDQMTALERDHMAAFLKNAVANAVINGYVADLDPMY